MSILKKSSLFTFVVALIMVMAMSVTAFGAEVPVDQESANAAATAEESVTTNDNEADSTVTGLTGAKFVKANGANYALGMGTGVIESAEMNGNTVRIYLKKKKVLWYRGWITQAYYTTPHNPLDNLVTGNPGADVYYMELDADRVVSFANGMRGIHLSELYFAFTPSPPPGMPNPVENAYFVCNQFASPAQ